MTTALALALGTAIFGGSACSRERLGEFRGKNQCSVSPSTNAVRWCTCFESLLYTLTVVKISATTRKAAEVGFMGTIKGYSTVFSTIFSLDQADSVGWRCEYASGPSVQRFTDEEDVRSTEGASTRGLKTSAACPCLTCLWQGDTLPNPNGEIHAQRDSKTSKAITF